jgi:hypothetical protein
MRLAAFIIEISFLPAAVPLIADCARPSFGEVRPESGRKKLSLDMFNGPDVVILRVEGSSFSDGLGPLNTKKTFSE